MLRLRLVPILVAALITAAPAAAQITSPNPVVHQPIEWRQESSTAFEGLTERLRVDPPRSGDPLDHRLLPLEADVPRLERRGGGQLRGDTE